MSDTATCSLVLADVSPAGEALCLKTGDRLVAVNGSAIEGGPQKLAKRFTPPCRSALLTFVRGELMFHVLSDSITLGPWEIGPAPEDDDLPARMAPDGFCNWEVFSAENGTYDIQPTSGSWLALVAPPLWLLQARLWGPFVAWAGISLAVLPAGLWAEAMAQIVMALYFWQAGAALFRADRLSKGMFMVRVLAERSETALHARLKDISPELRYVFAPALREDPVTTEST